MSKLFSHLNRILLCALSVMTFSTTYASIDLKSGCYSDEGTKEVKLLPNTTDERYPIASVSKVFTTLMAASKFWIGLPPDTKQVRAPFITEIFVRDVTTASGKSGFHVHIKGDNDPYFNRFKMHRVISMLNERGIGEIELLTFDENVKYLWDTDSKAGFYMVTGINPKNGKKITELIKPLKIKSEINFPSPLQVKFQLQEFWKVSHDYSKSFKSAKNVAVKMVNIPKFTVRKVEFISSVDYKLQKDPRNFHVESQNMATMLKMMNWNSNNYTANRIYSVSGGDTQFKDIFYTGLKASTTMLTFVNGSGQNQDLVGDGPRVYNESTCSIVLRTLKNLTKRLTNQGKNLTDVLSVVGIDVVGIYSNEWTKGKVVAKTGTVGTNITLAGAINTTNGLRYFMFNVGAKQQGNMIPEHQSRKLILDRLTALVRETPNVIPFQYKPNLQLMQQYGFENYEEDSEDAPPEIGPPALN